VSKLNNVTTDTSWLFTILAAAGLFYGIAIGLFELIRSFITEPMFEPVRVTGNMVVVIAVAIAVLIAIANVIWFRRG
jgi:hypothetical protein